VKTAREILAENAPDEVVIRGFEKTEWADAILREFAKNQLVIVQAQTTEQVLSDPDFKIEHYGSVS
jgi:hypothetical protein